jgi:hypothetical protein
MIVLTEELTRRFQDVCEARIESLLRGSEEPDAEDLHFESAALSQLLALQVLVQFVVSLAAGTTVAIIKSKWIKDKPADQLQHELTSRFGQGLRVGDAARKEECILVIEELLMPYGVTRDQARQIVEQLETAASR